MKSAAPRTLLRTMIQPRWIAGLVFALVVAGAFAWLGQWQLERAVESGAVIQRPTETAISLSDAAAPGGAIRSDMVGQLVTVKGSFVADDYRLINDRLNDGRHGYWVAAHFTLAAKDSDEKPVALAIARGWAPNKAQAREAVKRLSAEPTRSVTITGRLLPAEAPALPPENGDPRAMTTMSAAALYNQWHDVDGSDVYSAYVVEHDTPPEGLEAIYSPPPIEETTINWLNIFYAAEWAVFAGFAVFLWYRVVRDSWEREQEDAAAAELDADDEKVD